MNGGLRKIAGGGRRDRGRRLGRWCGSLRGCRRGRRSRLGRRPGGGILLAGEHAPVGGFSSRGAAVAGFRWRGTRSGSDRTGGGARGGGVSSCDAGEESEDKCEGRERRKPAGARAWRTCRPASGSRVGPTSHIPSSFTPATISFTRT